MSDNLDENKFAALFPSVSAARQFSANVSQEQSDETNVAGDKSPGLVIIDETVS